MSLASLTVDLTLGLAKFESDSGKAAQIITRDSERMAGAAGRFLRALEQQAAQAGKTRVELLALKAANLGVGDAAAGYIAKIEAASKPATAKFDISGIESARHATEGFSLSTVAARRELIVLAHELSQGSFSRFGGSLLVLAEQTGAASLLFSKLGLAAIGAAGAVAAAAVAIFLGARETEALNAALLLTGNAAGTTAGKFDEMAKSIAISTNSTAGRAREALQAVVASGAFGPALVQPVADAVIRMERLTDQSAEQIVADFATMGNGVAKYAAEHNRATHLLSVGQFELIRGLEEAGKAEQAQVVYLDALNQRLAASDKQIGRIATAWNEAKIKVAEYVNAVAGIGRGSTVEKQLDIARERLADAETAKKNRLDLPSLFGNTDDADIAKQRSIIAALENSQHLANQVAAATARSNAEQGKAIDASQFVEGYLRKAKSVGELNKALDAARTKFEDLAKVGKPVTAADQIRVLDEIRSDFKPRGASGLNDSNQARKATLEKDLKFLQDGLARERDALAFNQQELQAIYGAGRVSLTDFYAAKDAAIKVGVDAEVAALAAERVRLEKEFATPGLKGSDSINIQTKLQEIAAKTAKVETDAANAAKLSLIAREGEFKALAARVDEYRASLLQLQGDETGAAALRQKAAAEATRKLATESGGAISQDDIDKEAAAMKTASDFAEVQRRLGIATADASRAEAAYLLRAEQGGKGLVETEQGVYRVRAAALVQLGELRDKTLALAEASTDPKIKQAAADLVLQYAQAAQVVDPALNRLRDAGKQAGSSIAQSFGDAITRGGKLSDVVSAVGLSLRKLTTDALITKPLEGFLQNQLSGAATNLLGTSLGEVFGGGAKQGDSSKKAGDALGLLTTQTVTATAQSVTQTAASAAATASISALAVAATGAATALATVTATSATTSATSAGGLFGLGALLPSFDLPKLAEGTNFIPYDGFRAELHKGEAVVPAKFNPAYARAEPGGGKSQGLTIEMPVTIDARGADAGVEQRIRQAMAQTKAETLAAVQIQAGRGGSFSRAVGRR